MAAPGESLGTEDRGAPGSGDLEQSVEGDLELLRLHMVRITAKASVAPAGVDGIGASPSPTAESFHVPVTDPVVTEEAGEDIAVEVREAARRGETAYVNDLPNIVDPQQVEEVLGAVGGVTDREDRRRWRDPTRSLPLEGLGAGVGRGSSRLANHGLTPLPCRMRSLESIILPEV